MKERLTNLEVLRRQHQSIGPAIDSVNCLLEKPGDEFWPKRLHLEGVSDEIFLERARTRGGIVKSLREKTLPRLRDQEKQINLKVAELVGQIAEIEQLFQSGFLDQSALTRAQEILKKVKEPKPAPTPNSSTAEEPIGRNAARRRKQHELALTVKAAIERVDEKPLYTICDIAIATNRELDERLRGLIYDRIYRDRESGKPELSFTVNGKLSFRKEAVIDLVTAVLTARKRTQAYRVKPTAKETFITFDQHQMPQFKNEEYSRIIDLLLDRRQKNGKVSIGEIIALCSELTSSQVTLKLAQAKIHNIKRRIKPFGWIIDIHSEYDTESRKRRSSYSLRRENEKPLGDNDGINVSPDLAKGPPALIPHMRIVPPKALVVHGAAEGTSGINPAAEEQRPSLGEPSPLPDEAMIEDERKRRELEKELEQFRENITLIILSHIATKNLKKLTKKPDELLDDGVLIEVRDRWQKHTALPSATASEDMLNQFIIIDGFVKTLEAWWNDKNPGTAPKREEKIRKWLAIIKRQGYKVERLVRLVCNHFDIETPERYR